MGFINRLRAIAVVVVKRITSQPWLVLATTLGLVIATALMMSIPLYADAVYYRVFLQNLATDDTPPGQVPPFTFLYRYDGSIYGTKEWDEMAEVDAYLSQEAANTFGLPELLSVRYFTTDPYGLFADETSVFESASSPLVWAGFTFISDLADHIEITEGVFPRPSLTADGSPVEVLIHEDLAVRLGLQVNETYIAFTRQRTDDEFVRNVQIPVRISGVWRPQNRQDAFWFFNPSSFVERMMVPEETFAGAIGQQMRGEVYTAAWYLVLDAGSITHTDANPLIRRAMLTQQRAGSLMPNTKLGRSPVDALFAYRRSTNLLTVLLYAFSVPIFGLLFAFITLTSGLSVERRRNEIAVLRSRGAMQMQMLGISAVEGVLLGLAALAISVPVGMLLARLIGQARSFLDFSAGLEALRVTLTQNALQFGVVAILVSIAAQVVPTIGAAEHTVVSYKREQARAMRKPWWQRVGLDLLLFIPTAYGAYLLQQQGSIVQIEDRLGNAPLQNPLLFLVPALGIFALTLFFLRLMPLVMSVVAWIAARTRAVGLVMAARHLARTPSFYTTPLILLVLTLSLSAFTASLAHTLDAHLYAQSYYRAGADIEFLDTGEDRRTGLGGMLMGGGQAQTDEAEDEGPRWLFFPISDYLDVPGVDGAMRVARYPAVSRVLGTNQSGIYMGVDRAAFPSIAYWRSDFASQSLGALMNALAMDRRGVLVDEEFMRHNILNPGDEIRITVVSYGQNTVLDLKVLGSFKLFPGWYPSEGPLFVGDIDYFFEQAGGLFPYRVWLATQPDVDLQWLAQEGLRIRGVRWLAPLLTVEQQQQAPERQGLFGLLSVGFAAAALLTVLGFLLYALFSFRRRFIEFGVLRAVGLSAKQMTAFLGWELALLIGMGGGLGTILGGWVSAFFIPFLQVGADEMSRIPPYIVDVAWQEIFRIYMLFGVLFVVALVALIVMLRRMRIFEAVKLGETA